MPGFLIIIIALAGIVLQTALGFPCTGLTIELFNNSAAAGPPSYTFPLQGEFSFQALLSALRSDPDNSLALAHASLLSTETRHPFSLRVLGTLQAPHTSTYEFEWLKYGGGYGTLYINDIVFTSTTSVPIPHSLDLLKNESARLRLDYFHNLLNDQPNPSGRVQMSILVNSRPLSAYVTAPFPSFSPAHQQRHTFMTSTVPKGWGTWNSEDPSKFVRLPEGVQLHVWFKNNQTQHTSASGSANFASCDRKILPELHAPDHSYTHLTYVLDEYVITLESTVSSDDQLYVVAHVSRKYAAVECPSQVSLFLEYDYTQNRTGGFRTNKTMSWTDAQPHNLRPTRIRVLSSILSWTGNTIELQFDKDTCRAGFTAGISSAATLKDIVAIVAQKRTQTLEELGASLPPSASRDLVQGLAAIQSVTGWNIVYNSVSSVVVPVSRKWSFSFSGIPSWDHYVLFEWDNFFASLQLSRVPRAKHVCYANYLATISGRTSQGCLVNFAAAGHKSNDRTEPPVAAQVLVQIYNTYQEKWIVQAVIQDLIDAHDWFWKHRRLRPHGLIALGSDDLPSDWAHHQKQGAVYESGLDNSPMYDDTIFDANSSLLQLYDVGMSGLVVAEAQALMYLAGEIGWLEKVQHIAKHAEELKELIQKHLWDDESGLYTNKYNANEEFSRRHSPTSFYPWISRIAIDEQVEKAIPRHLRNSSRFCIHQERDDVPGQGCNYGMPSIAYDDPAFKDQSYWRGRTWGPHNLLSYWAFQTYAHVPGMKETINIFTKRSLQLVLKAWRDGRHVGENYDPVTAEICNVPNADPFYHWGGLNAFIAILEEERQYQESQMDEIEAIS